MPIEPEDPNPPDQPNPLPPRKQPAPPKAEPPKRERAIRREEGSREDDFVPAPSTPEVPAKPPKKAPQNPGAAVPSSSPSISTPKKSTPAAKPRRKDTWLARYAPAIFVANLAALLVTFAAGWQMYYAWDLPRQVEHVKPDLEHIMVIDNIADHDAETIGQSGGPAAMMRDKIMISFKEAATPAQMAEVANEMGLSFIVPYAGAPRVVTAKIDPARRAELLNRLNSHPTVIAAEPDFVYWPQFVPNDKGYPMQWNLQMINMETAWEYTRGSNAVVAVIDTGVMIQQGANSFVLDDLAKTVSKPGYDFAYNDSIPEDFQGHGSHVAGTIAQSTHNSNGVAGVAFEAAIMPVKVFPNRGGAQNSAIVAGIRFAADNGANVINMSLGGPAFSQIMDDAIQYAYGKGVTVVVAAGNSGRSEVMYPAGCNHVIAVSAVDRNQNLTGYSTYGFHVEIAAPGGVTDVLSQGGFMPRVDFIMDRMRDKPTGIIQNTVYFNGQTRKLEQGYRSFQGTSMASPHVAGVAALIYSLGVTNPMDIRTAIRTTAVRKDPPEKYGAGILDAAAAVKSVAKSGQVTATKLNVGVIIAVAAGAFYLFKGGGLGLLGSWLPEATGLVLGLVAPDYLTKHFGFTSYANLAAHSVVIPAIIVFVLDQQPLITRFCSFLAAGIGVTVFLAHQTQTTLIPVLDPQKTQIWFVANIIFAILILANYWANMNRWRGWRVSPAT